MKKILLVGDSIRKGYDRFVKIAYEGKAEVYYPEENCRFSEYVLRNLHEWAEQTGCGRDVDCVHWNAGLWDAVILFNDGTLTPIDVYKTYIDRICQRINLLFPKAKVIFATSTPVIETQYGKNFKRYNKDIEAFNDVAAETVKKYGHDINDLYSLLKAAPSEYHSDMTHFYTKAATKVITEKVATEIEHCIGIKASTVDYDKYFCETKEVLGQ